MRCRRCGKKMLRVDLRLSSFVGGYKYAYICQHCKKSLKQTQRRGEDGEND